jgi:hypothetical protein
VTTTIVVVAPSSDHFKVMAYTVKYKVCRSELSRAAGTNVNVYRNTKVITTANDGTYEQTRQSRTVRTKYATLERQRAQTALQSFGERPQLKSFVMQTADAKCQPFHYESLRVQFPSLPKTFYATCGLLR